MRMWLVLPALMCDKHLLGEHVEMHMFVGTIDKGKKLDGYIRDGLIDTAFIQERHDELAKEMKERGMRHESPLTRNPVPLAGHATSVNRLAAMRELVRRCPACRSKIEPAFRGVLDFSDIPLGGDGVIRLANGEYGIKLNGTMLPTTYAKRDAADIGIERARRKWKTENNFT